VAHFVGGPCDKRDVGANFNATLVCGGVTYTRGAGGNYYPEQETTGPVGVAALGSHGPRGWADLQRAVNVSLPTGLSRAKVLTRAAHRKLMQRRRVR
jgi:hypothetical protein